jgi:hypothetical protein
MKYLERLNKFDDLKLIDVVKNYRQYGYDDELRGVAISILNERGITNEQLQLTGNFEKTTYDFAQELYDDFSRNSKIAFILYGVLWLSNILALTLTSSSLLVGAIAGIISWLALIGYFTFLIKSFINQHRYYKTISQDYGAEGALIYLFIGMPFYILMYFFFRRQMRERMPGVK